MKEYREQRDKDGILLAYTHSASGATIPISEGNADYQKVLIWLAAGNTPDVDPDILPKAKRVKIAEYKDEAVKRISTQVTAWNSLEDVRLIASVWNMLGTPNAAQTKAKDIYLYVKNTAIPNVNAQVDIASVQAIDVVNDVNWP